MWAADQEGEAETWRGRERGWSSREGREERAEVRSGNSGGLGRVGEPEMGTESRGGGRCRVEMRKQAGAVGGLLGEVAVAGERETERGRPPRMTGEKYKRRQMQMEAEKEIQRPTERQM